MALLYKVRPYLFDVGAVSIIIRFNKMVSLRNAGSIFLSYCGIFMRIVC